MKQQGKNKEKRRDERWVWWKHGVIYQVYPRSFYDSNDDGIGDIKGMTIKLGYLAELGIDALLLNPISKSSMIDCSYAISDYLAIDPSYGIMDDFKELIKEAHAHNIKIIMDVTLNYTSNEHPWFLESRSSKNNPKHDWYIWHDGPAKKNPNNWQSVYGGSAWEWDATREQFYYHSFLKQQPDLNWRNKAVRQEVYKTLQFWLDLGVDGLRLDLVNFYIKDEDFRNNHFMLRPNANFQDRHAYMFDKNRPEVHDILKELRELVDKNEAILLGEIYSVKPGDPRLSVEYVRRDELHLVLDYSLIYARWGAKRFYACIDRLFSLLPEKQWPCNFLSNHDFSRLVSRIGQSIAKAKVAGAFLLTIKGTPIIYYGEEIGMRDLTATPKQVQQQVGKGQWPVRKKRDPMRSPMQWNEEVYAGFTHHEPWIPLNNDYTEINANTQSYDRDSLLSLYKSLIALRKKKKSLHKGDMFPLLDGSNDLLAYYRVYEFEKILVILNFSANCRRLNYSDSEKWKVLFSNEKIIGQEFSSLRFEVEPFEITILESIGMLNFQVEYV